MVAHVYNPNTLDAEAGGSHDQIQVGQFSKVLSQNKKKRAREVAHCV